LRVPKFPIIAAATVLSILALAWALDIRSNLTASLPLGLYIATDQPTDYVVFCLGGEPEKIALARQYITPGHCPGGGTPLLKQIAARPGDRVIYSAAGIAVNGKLLLNTAPRLRDGAGRPLTGASFGNYTVPHGAFWVVSSYDQRSFDSRYYSAVPASAVRLHVKPLLVSR
jgi:conjugative transfer signal peptidase TraF